MTQKERLVELLDSSCCPQKDDYYRYEDYLDALAEYLVYHGVIVPPCKVGDTVYRLWSKQGIVQQKVKRFQCGTYGLMMCTSSGCFPLTLIGDNVFLTREEAEQASKERKNEIQIATKNGIFNG